MKSAGSRYRPDIQGLRAIAVGAIVLFHTFPNLLPGGFVGVDIFFVISGFLITGILYRDILKGSFSLADFYRRRIRRIFPALFVVLPVTLVVGFFLLSPEAYRELARNTLSSTLFVSNIDFWRSSGYFDRAAELRPLLHTWSLAVEEQFYIVFPVTLWAVMRYAQRLLFPLLLLGFFGSLLLSEWALTHLASPIGAYFLTPFRIYELLLGSILALSPVPQIFNRRGLRNVTVVLGFSMILASVFILTPKVPFPGYTALLPIMGTGFVLFAGRSGDSLAARLITSRPFLFIGAISYSLYLWHWPVLSYLRVASQPDHASPVALFAAMCLSIGLAALSYRFVERPLAHRSITTLPFLRLGMAGMAGICLLAGFVMLNQGLPSRFSPEALRMFAGTQDYSPERARCHRGRRQDIPYDNTCVLGAPEAPPDVVLWADSHGAELSLALGEYFKTRNRGVRQITASACPPVVGVDFAVRPTCRPANESMLEALVNDDQVNVVILAINAVGYFETGMDRAEMRAGLEAVLKALRAANKKVLVLTQIPNINMDAASLAGYATSFGRDPVGIGRPRDEVVQEADAWQQDLVSLAQKYGVLLFDPVPVLCSETLCPIANAEAVLYFNEVHVSMAGARILAQELGPNL